MLNTIDMEQFERVVQEVKDRAEGFLYAGASTRRAYYTCSRTARPSEIVRDGLESGDRVNTQRSFIQSVCSEERSEESESFWLGSDVIGEHLGSGWYSNVYQAKFNENLVIKLGTGQGKDGDIFRDGWLDYAHYVLKTGPGLILPGIEALQIHPDDGVYIALLHKYECCLSEMERSMDVAPFEIEAAQSKRAAITHGLGRGYGNTSIHASSHPNYYNAGVRVKHGLDRIGVRSYDLHDGNFMLTKHGRLVMTDPTANDCSESTKDFLSSLLKEAA